MLSRGVPMLLAGDELRRTQGGNNNPSCHDSETTWIDWSRADADLIAITTREIALPKQLKDTDFEIVAYQVGGEARVLGGTHGEPLHYVPWHTGVYWILACHPEECFVIAASRQGG